MQYSPKGDSLSVTRRSANLSFLEVWYDIGGVCIIQVDLGIQVLAGCFVGRNLADNSQPDSSGCNKEQNVQERDLGLSADGHSIYIDRALCIGRHQNA